jgi:hypothetical protein
MRKRLIVIAVAVAAAVAGGLVAAGWSSSASSSTDLGGGAAIAPANAAAFVAIDSDLSSSQWHAVDGLLSHVPSSDTLLAGLRARFEQRTKLSWADDVEPALGSELDLVVLPGTKPKLVGLTRGGDKAKLDALLHELGPSTISEQIDGWTAFAQTQAALDAVANATTKLATDSTYRAAVAKLDGDALVHAYANGAGAAQLLAAVPGAAAAAQSLAWAATDVVASDGGLRVDGYTEDGPAQRSQAPPPVAVRSNLLDEIPAGAVAVADFQVTPGAIDFTDPSVLPNSLRKLIADYPSLPGDLQALLGGETAFYVRPGLPIPELTLVTQPADTHAAELALADLEQTLRRALASSPGGTMLAAIPIVHAVLGGQLIVSTSQQGLDAFRSAGAKLSSDPGFKAAQQASGMPSQTTGFLYVDLPSVLPVVQVAAPLLGLQLPAGFQGAAGALTSLTAWGTRTGAESSYSALLAVG